MSDRDGWGSAKAAQRYVRVQADMVPGRGEVLALIATLVSGRASARPCVLDLGCGHGEIAAEILKRAPDAVITMVDFSDEMLERARQRFDGDARISIVKQDLNQGLPEALRGRRFDAVVSCFAIHHVAPQSRVALYRQVRGVLEPDGLFVDGDRFVEESPGMAAWAFDAWVAWMVKRAKERFGLTRTPAEIRQRQLEMDEKLGDQPGSIWAMRGDLQAAGFASVDCLYKNQITGVIVASPEPPAPGTTMNA